MKMNHLMAGFALLALLAVAPATRADTTTNAPTAKPIPYPLKTCPVSDDKLGEMGPPYVFVYQGQEIKFCCPDCKKDFLKDPAKYLKKIKEAAAKLKQQPNP
jgi:YHS domain-containing protein